MKEQLEIFQKVTAKILDRLGFEDDPSGEKSAKKAAGVITSSEVDFLNQPKIERLINATKKQSGFLKAFNWRPVTQQKGKLPVNTWSGWLIEKTEGFGDTGVNDYKKGSLTSVAFDLSEGHISVFMPFTALVIAGAAGLADFEQKWRAGLAEQIANNIGEIVLRGDRDLDDTTDENRGLRMFDGILKLAKNYGNYKFAGTALGKDISTLAYTTAKGMMPSNYRRNRRNTWLHSDVLTIALVEKLLNDTDRQLLADRVFTGEYTLTPLGHPILQCELFPIDGNGGVAAATPDSVTGTTEVTARVNALLPDTTDYSGRQVKVTCLDTEEYEIVTVTRVGGQNLAVTTGKLGQPSVSTTAADYEVELADLTSIVYGDPRNYSIFYGANRAMAFRRWDQKRRGWEIDIWLDLDFNIDQREAVTMLDGIITPAVGGTF